MIDMMRANEINAKPSASRGWRLVAGGMAMAVMLAAPGLLPAQEKAAGGAEDTVRAAVQQLVGGSAQVGEIRPSPIRGMYEVEVARHLIYVEEQGQYAFIDGNLVDLKNRRDLTQERMTELMRIDFKKELPLDKALKQVYGKGERVLAIFEDPNCSYCRRMRSVLSRIDNLTLYTFTYPILSASSHTKSQKAWCAKDPAKAWGEMMTSGKEPDNAGDCKTPVAEIVELGKRLNVTGTPTMFFPDGSRVPGAISMAQLEQLLARQDKGSKQTGSQTADK